MQQRIRLRWLAVFSLFFQVSTAQNLGAEWVIAPILTGFDTFQIFPKQDESLLFVTKNGQKGVFDKTGKLILPSRFREISLLETGWIRTFTSTKTDYWNLKGEQISLPFETFLPQPGMTAIVSGNGKFGVVNQTGEEIVLVDFDRREFVGETGWIFFKGTTEKGWKPPVSTGFKNAERVANARARAVLDGLKRIDVNGKSGFLNEKGDTVIPPVYHLGTACKRQFIAAKLGENWGVLDSKNQPLHPFTAPKIGYWTESGLLPMKENGSWVVKRFPAGEVVSAIGTWDFIEVYDAKKDLFLVSKGKAKGMMTAGGKLLLPVEFEYISQADHITTALTKNRKWGYWFRPTGQPVEPSFRNITNFGDSLCIFQREDGSGGFENGVLDVKTGQVIVPFGKPTIQKSGPYFMTDIKYDQSAQQTAAGRHHVLFDRAGRVICAVDSSDFTVFPDGSFFIEPHHKKSVAMAEHRSPDGKLLRTMPKNNVSIEMQHWFKYRKTPDGRYESRMHSYLDEPGKEVLYENVQWKTEEKLRLVRLGDRFGFTSLEGKVVVPVVLEAAFPSEDGYMKVKYGGKWGVLQNPFFDWFEEAKKGGK